MKKYCHEMTGIVERSLFMTVSSLAEYHKGDWTYPYKTRKVREKWHKKLFPVKADMTKLTRMENLN